MRWDEYGIYQVMSSKSARNSGLIGVLCAGLLVSGCASMIAPRIVAPQRGGLESVLESTAGGRFMLQIINAYISARLTIAVGPPPAELAVDVVPPGQYDLTFGEKRHSGCSIVYLAGSAESQFVKSMGHQWLSARHMTKAEARRTHAAINVLPAPPGSQLLVRYQESIARLRSTFSPKGTVILLPGYGLGKLSMLPWALLLGRAGFQSILVDPRAQGQSTGNYVTYGTLESRDLVQLIAALRKAGLIRGRLGLLGDSMGAATALLAAPQLPDVAAIVAISPYARASSVIPRYARFVAWYANRVTLAV